MNLQVSALALVSLLSAAPAWAQSCPVLQGEYQCGPRGGRKEFRLVANTSSNLYTFSDGGQQSFQIMADGQSRQGNLGGPGKDATYTANCSGGKLVVDFRMRTDINGQQKLLSAVDSYYNERGGLVQVRIYNRDSEVKGSPRVLSCSPIVGRRPQQPPAQAQPQPYQQPAEPPLIYGPDPDVQGDDEYVPPAYVPYPGRSRGYETEY